MEAAAEQGNQAAIKELEEQPPLPDLCASLWAIYLDIDATRDNNGFGPLRLKYREIDAWARLTKNKLAAWELATIVRLDGLFMTVHNEAKKTEGA